jgi:predicted DNA-binding ribbon-helix-helix protein
MIAKGSKRVQITMPDKFYEELAELANDRNLTISELLIQAWYPEYINKQKGYKGPRLPK